MTTEIGKQSDYSGADLVWSRYNAIVVAATVGAGFLANYAHTYLTNPDGSPWVGAVASILSACACVAWWLMTSYGWSLLHLECTPSDRYRQWLSWKWKDRRQDPIWWCAHGIIALFYVGYTLLAALFLGGAARWLWLTIALAVLAWLTWLSVLKLDIHASPPDLATDQSADRAILDTGPRVT